MKITGSLQKDVETFFYDHGFPLTLEHSINVAQKAKEIAIEYNVDPDLEFKSGLLHDVSVIIPNQKRAVLAEELGLEVVEEEKIFPLIAHQKLSKVMARELLLSKTRPSCRRLNVTQHSGKSQAHSILFCLWRIKSSGINQVFRHI